METSPPVADMKSKVYVGKLGNAYFYRNEIAGQTDFFYGDSYLLKRDAAFMLMDFQGLVQLGFNILRFSSAAVVEASQPGKAQTPPFPTSTESTSATPSSTQPTVP